MPRRDPAIEVHDLRFVHSQLGAESGQTSARNVG
jgi:hypothetical protein